MKVTKAIGGSRWKRREEDYFVRRHGDKLDLSCAIRDKILPKEYVSVEVEGDMIFLTPTDDKDEYKVSIDKNHKASLTFLHIQRYVEIQPRKRYKAIYNRGQIVIFTKTSLDDQETGGGDES